jgi:hypothetical protein
MCWLTLNDLLICDRWPLGKGFRDSFFFIQNGVLSSVLIFCFNNLAFDSAGFEIGLVALTKMLVGSVQTWANHMVYLGQLWVGLITNLIVSKDSLFCFAFRPVCFCILKGFRKKFKFFVLYFKLIFSCCFQIIFMCWC